jgi:hypothetical protein
MTRIDMNLYLRTLSMPRLFAALALACATVGAPAQQRQEPRSAQPLQLFGTPLKGASRQTLRQTLAEAGLQPVRVDDGYFCDQYRTNGVPEGSSELTVCYTEDTNIFALAEYTFPSFVDVGQIGRVIDTVAVKYGRPGSVQGQYGLGPVTATWPQPGNMLIRVRRGWPSTTTYLNLIDLSNEKRMRAQMEAAEKARQRQRAMRDAHAF